jgi:hypothetical protein
VKVALDENLPPALAHALCALLLPEGGEAISIPERFGRGIHDVDWMGRLREEGGWGFITTDRRLRTRPHERLALRQSGLVGFVLAKGWNQERYWPKAAGIIRWWPVMAETLATASPPALFEVPHRWKPVSLRPLP